ncbi:kinesin-like protein KIF18A [Neodiprion fabricii]|uniref:kinesin-like protein KIF18A n=1 Tax=Neodiprion fabricii TaxID=2872261 RepID=UPI001ED9209F|nr:kinesin-like protein KIF18A [Neodiprion fabricii]XP_046410876.1 kinesin-like protein KIF18A [Neodiprion fabricii]
MVFNRKDLAKAFSPNKLKVHARKRPMVGNSSQKCTTNGVAGNSVKSDVGGSRAANVRVIVRVRPENERELQGNQRIIVKTIDDKMLIFDPKAEENPFYYQGVAQKGRDLLKKQNKEMEFIFDRVFDSTATNLDVFQGSTKNVITTLLDGYNCSVFVYGATGAGKTHTMLGGDGDPGITYLTMAELFSEINEQSERKEFNLGVSYLEVYNENVQDLLVKSGPLHIREDGSRGIMVAGLTIITIKSADELLALLAKGNKNRTQHPTDANAESSRSHAVFQVYVKMKNKLDGQARHVKLSMIDLAGSERASATGCKGARFKEGANINKSLLALGNCINNLADGLSHIPYRDSKLTRLLKDSLGGNCHTVMIANVSPSNFSYEDTYNTLRYANRAKKIKTNMKKNVVSCQIHITGYIKMVEEQKKEIESLKRKLLEVGSSSAAPLVREEEDLSEWHTRISQLHAKKRVLNAKILSLESTDKILCCRIEYKKKANSRLRALSFDVDAVVPDDVNTSGKTRVNKSMCFFKRQRESIKIQMDAAWNELREIETELHNLNLEIESNGLSNKLADKILICKKDINQSIVEQQLEHSKKLSNLQESEIHSTGNIVQLVGKTLVRFFNLMHGYGTITEPMREEFKQLIKTSEGVKSIKWSDEELTMEEKQFHNFCSLSIEQLDNPLQHESPPSPMVLLEDDENANNSIINTTFDTLPTEEDLAKLNNATMTVDAKEASLTELESEDCGEDEITDEKGIDTEKLNNTFNLIENKAKKRVLMDKNHVTSKPTASKLAKKLTPQKTQKPLRENNSATGKENKTVPKSVMSAKSIAILNKMKAERMKNLQTVVNEPFSDQPNLVHTKTMRVKDKRGLLSSSHPYNRPSAKQKFNSALPSSRVPW